MAETTYHYRSDDNDDWEVYSVRVEEGEAGEDGERREDWVATVSTETLAETLVFALTHSMGPRQD